MRPNIKFHDGNPLTSDDVKFTYDLMMNKDVGSPRYSTLTERIKSVEASDPATIVITLNDVVAPFLIQDAGYGIVPKHILQNVAPADIAKAPLSTGDPKATIGSGPFKFQSWVKGDNITLVKNPDYFKGEPALDQYVYRIVKDFNAVSAALKTGEIDYGGFPPSFLADMSKQANINVFQYDTFTFTFYAYQLDPAKSTLFQDKRVRQALAYALDREGMVKAILFGTSKVAVGTEPVLSWAYAPDQITAKYSYDVAKAKSLLDDAGWKPGSDGIRAKDGTRLSFKLWTNSGNNVRESYITYMQQAWKEIGVEATPSTEEWNAYLDRLTKTRDFDIFLVGFSWGVDPDQTTMWATKSYTGGFNMNKYSNTDVDKLLQEGLTTLDQAKRKQIYVQMQNLVMEDLPSFITDFPQNLAGLNKRVQNLLPNAVNIRSYAHLWWVNDGK